jgi:Ca2+-binding RTX toxin-like protein
MPYVTVTGGAGQPSVVLQASATDKAYVAGLALASGLNATFSSQTVDTVTGGIITPGGHSMVIATDHGVSTDLSGYEAIVVNNPIPNQFGIVENPTGVQSILAGLGGFAATIGGSSNITIAALGGDNLIDLSANSGVDSVVLSTGDDLVKVGSGFSVIDVGGGANTVFGGSGYDFIYGGTGSTTVVAGTGQYNIDAGPGGGTFAGGTGGANNIFGSTAPGAGSVYIVGGHTGDTLSGGVGDDTILAGVGTNVKIAGLGGHDSFVGGTGDDIFTVDGTDTVSLGSAYNKVVVDTGNAVIQGSAAASTYLDFIGSTTLASTILGGGGSYNINAQQGGGVFTGGSAGHNNIFGSQQAGAGSVTITGGGSNDLLTGGLADDVIYAGNGTNIGVAGGGGHDSFIGGSGAAYFTIDGTDTVQLGTGYAFIDASGGSAVVQGAASTILPGISLNFLNGASASTVLGGAGKYDVNGGVGGGLFYAGTAGGSNVYAGSGAATIVGGGNGDWLFGGSGAASIVAAAGHSQDLAAGTGVDTLVGAAGGTDNFDFLHIGASTNTYLVQNFTSAKDFITLSSVTDYNYAQAHNSVSGGSTFIGLSGGATIELSGFSGGIAPVHIVYGPGFNQ